MDYFFKKVERKVADKTKREISTPLKLTPPDFIVWIQGFKFSPCYFVLITVLNYAIFQETFT